MARRISFGMDGKPRVDLRPLMQYPGKAFPARKSIAPGESQNILVVTRQDVHGHVRDEPQ